MAKSISKFIASKGGVGLIVSLNEGEKMWTELKEEIGVANDTLSTRKREASDIGLVEIVEGQYQARETDFYRLTEMGEELADRMVRNGLASNWQDMRTHEQKVEELTEDLVEWSRENPGAFAMYREANEETYIKRSGEDETESTEQDPVSNDDAYGGDDDDVDTDDEDGVIEPDEVWGEESAAEEDSGQLDLDDVFGSGDED